MKDIIQQIIRWFQEFWAGLSPQHRKKIIDAVVASLEHALRKFYQACRAS